MPVKLGSKTPPAHSEARIEIIPLIDIMFFLLAAFMLVSLSMANVNSVKVSLPAAAQDAAEHHRDLVNISVDKTGLAYLGQAPVALNELTAALAARKRTNDTLRVLISGDKDCRHGDIIRVLDAARAAGIDQVGFQVEEPAGAARP